MTLRTCVTCVFSRPPLTDDGMEHRPEDDRPFLFCQRFPPTLPGPLDAFPAVSPGEVCGEWCATSDASDGWPDDTSLEDGDEAALEDLLCELTAITISRFNTIDARLDAIQRHLTPVSVTLLRPTPDAP